MNSAENFLRRAWSWLKERLKAFWSILVWLFDMVCCCGCIYDDENEDYDFEKGKNQQNIQTVSGGTAKANQTTMSGANAGAGGQVHKVIMVGSGGVGKSALTLQFMYDEVVIFQTFKSSFVVFKFMELMIFSFQFVEGKFPLGVNIWTFGQSWARLAHLVIR